MKPERWQRIKSILADALEYQEPPARAAFLTEACAGDAALRDEVDSFLAEDPDGLEKFAVGPEAMADHETTKTNTGRRLGAYELLRELGRGGMGTVWLARRADERFEQEVAIKLLKRGTDTEEVLRRFRAERRILGRLEHPGIARLLDAGESDDGLPFFVMEYVAGGERLTAYAQQHALSIPARLELFRKVCAAVQFAHQNLVVHRDLKPGNILVTPDGDPKLLDFGIAKLLARGDDAWEVTALGSERLTPAYASPEQVRGESVTTVSDVYALGALLYELLTGSAPHRFVGVRPSQAELLQVICEEEPLRPSIAADEPEMRRLLRGDLDTIVLRAMSKAPERRYVSAGSLSDDLRRFLEGKPVRARPDTLGYRAQKFVARNRTASAAAAVVLITLVTSVIVTRREASIARQQRSYAERRFQDLRKVATSFLFELDDAMATRPTAARELLVLRAREYLDGLATEAGADPSLQSELAAAYQKLGDVQSQLNQANIGDTASALVSYDKALRLREALFAAAKSQTASESLRLDLATSYRRLGDILTKTGNTASALENYRKTLPLLDLGEAAAISREMRIALASNHEIIGRTLYRSGDFPAAAAEYREALAVIQPLTSVDSGDPAPQLEQTKTLSSLAYLLAKSGHKEEALGYYRQNAAITAQLASADPQNPMLRRRLMESHEWVGTGLRDCGDFAAALAEYDVAEKLCETALQADSANVQARNDLADIRHNIGITRYRQGDANGALVDFLAAKEFYESVAATDGLNVHAQRQVLVAGEEVGEALALSGDVPAGLTKLRETLSGFQRLAAKDPINTEFQGDEARAEARVGELLGQLGSSVEAKQHFEKARPIFQRLSKLAPADETIRSELTQIEGALAVQ
jgi:non-specific serine/threonine protein kinase/serine/threonine-protein kinase